MPLEIGPQYKAILKKYVENQSERDLYAGQKFSRQFIEKEIPPEEVIGIHKYALQELFPHLPIEIWYSFDFLIEMMIHYGLTLQEHQSLVRKQEEIELEMKIAGQVQKTLLKTKVPKSNEIDIGFVSIPAKQMSGDYVYFLNSGTDFTSVAVSDVIGKGIPAALCMSMIKFGMDSMEEKNPKPKLMLEVVNRIVEDNIDDSMFISMFYGKYNARTSKFSFASAGHEPALLFKAKEESFMELDADGLLLGVQRDVQFDEHTVLLEKDDFVAIMTDGVTETRTDEGFIDEQYIRDILFEVRDERSQVIADTVYKKLGELQAFHLRDDFTIVILKRK